MALTMQGTFCIKLSPACARKYSHNDYNHNHVYWPTVGRRFVECTSSQISTTIPSLER